MSKAGGSSYAVADAENVSGLTVGRFVTYTSSFPPPVQQCVSGFYSMIETRTVKPENQNQEDPRLSMLMHTVLAVGHDINNALVLLYGALDLIAHNTDGSNNGYLVPANLAANRIRELSAQLMGVSREGLPSHDKPFAPVKTLRKIVDFCTANSDVHAEFDLEDGLWPILMDASTFSQIVQNLALNARQAMPGGGTLVITARNRRSADGIRYAMLRLQDQGCGIGPEELKHIFCPNYTTKKDGHGIGLSFVKRAVEGCGGKIEMSSTVGYGTTFTLLLPAKPKEP